jgi:hypothetical protein
MLQRSTEHKIGILTEFANTIGAEEACVFCMALGVHPRHCISDRSSARIEMIFKRLDIGRWRLDAVGGERFPLPFPGTQAEFRAQMLLF